MTIWRRIRPYLLISCTCLLILEVALRLGYPLIGGIAANELAKVYQISFSGIYEWDPQTQTKRMKPNFSRQMYFNGYEWMHKTDHRGFRNPPMEGEIDGLLVGDSMVYGHGVDLEGTIAYQLQELSGKTAYNMGQSEHGPHEEYLNIIRYVPELKPKKLLLFFLFNDLSDLTYKLTDEQMQNFVNSSDDDHSLNYIDIENTDTSFKYKWGGKLAKDIYLIRAANFIKNRLQGRYINELYPIDKNPLENPRTTLAMEFTKKMLLKVQNLCDENNIQFHYIYLDTGNPHDQIFFNSLHQFTKKNSLPMHRYKVQNVLPNDGHFSKKGAMQLATLLNVTLYKEVRILR